MNVLKESKFLLTLLVVTILGVLGFGYLLYANRGKYAAALTAFEEATTKKAGLERQKPYPNDENARKFKSSVQEFEAAAEKLRQEMRASQGELPAAVSPTKFQDNLRTKVEAYVQRAQAEQIRLPSAFYLGFEEYRAATPLQSAATKLQFQLDAICWLMDTLFDSGSRFVEIKRTKMDFEKAQAAPAAGGPKPKPAAKPGAEGPEICELELSFGIGPAGFQQVMNKLGKTNNEKPAEEAGKEEKPKTYYFVPRFFRVDNEKKEGFPRTQLEPPSEDEQEPGAAPVAAKPEPVKEGLTIAFGTETVRVYLALDLTRFEEIKPPAAAKPAKK